MCFRMLMFLTKISLHILSDSYPYREKTPIAE